MNKLQAMEVFVNVVDAGGFTRAAEIMQLPKATVSTLIQSLEASLAVKLLHRTTRHVSVTADGAAYYERCLRILSDVRDAEESLSRTRLSPSGRLRIDVPTGLAGSVLVPALPDFFTRYPDIQMEMGCSDRAVDLVEEGVDCAVRAGQLVDSSLIARRVGILHFATCAAPSYLDRYGRPAHPDELTRHLCVNYFSAKTGKIIDWDFSRGTERVQVALPGHIALNDTNAYVAAGEAGLGIVQMPNFLLDPLLADGRFEQVLAEWTSDPVPIHVVYPQNRHLSAKVRVFVEWVAELLSNHPGMRLPKAPPPAARAASYEVVL
nr:LysR substrate-binding domain-containing protein [uncultured Duganella sp.]